MSDTAGLAIRTESLTKIYHGSHIALNCVDLEVEAGTVLGVLGQNGAGKTTLVRLLMGLHAPTAGRVYILGQRMTANSAALRRRMGYVSADPKFPRKMTPIEYLDYVGKLGGIPGSQRRAKLASLLRAVDLLHYSGQPIDRFSTGMKTRLAIAASLINDPEVLVWDEPSQGLDPEARRNMVELMQNMAAAKTLLLCSHNLQDVQEVCDTAIVLHDGQIIFNGDLSTLKGSSRPSDIEISLVGDRKLLAESVKSIQDFEELESCKLTKTQLRLRIREDVSHATALANVLVTLADRQVEMSDLKISGAHTEQAIANLLIQEGSRGLTRAYQPEDG